MKPKLLVVELWGLGDLIIATPFLQVACEKYAVSLVAKPYAQDLRERFWPEVCVRPFVAPWTPFRRKYRLWAWPWAEIWRLRRLAASERYDIGLAARWDPRDHLLLRLLCARRRLGFPRMRSQVFLTDPLTRPEPAAHRYENWRVLARALDLDLPPRDQLPVRRRHHSGEVLIHTGAGQPVRVWPLERYRWLAERLRRRWPVQVACDPDQRQWWLDAGEKAVATPRSATELLALVDRAAVFLGNDSGPAHLAAFCGVPTFTLFGPQLAEWFAPLHPAGEWIEGKPCPYKPCSDYCRFPVPYCMAFTTEEEVWSRIAPFVARFLHDSMPAVPASQRAIWPTD